jgi:hypothetical protein
MAQQKEPKATPVKRVAKLKRKAHSAQRSIDTREKRIKLLQQKLKNPKLSFSERQFIQGKMTLLKVERYEAQKNYRTSDNAFKSVVRQNNMIQKDQFRGQKYEDRILPGYDQYFFNWRVLLEAAAKKDEKIRELQMELVELAGGDAPSLFNERALDMLELVDAKPVQLLMHTKHLKPRLLKSLDKFFGDVPKYLPEPFETRFEKSLAARDGDDEVDEDVQ